MHSLTPDGRPGHVGAAALSCCAILCGVYLSYGVAGRLDPNRALVVRSQQIAQTIEPDLKAEGFRVCDCGPMAGDRSREPLVIVTYEGEEEPPRTIRFVWSRRSGRLMNLSYLYPHTAAPLPRSGRSGELAAVGYWLRRVDLAPKDGSVPRVFPTRRTTDQVTYRVRYPAKTLDIALDRCTATLAELRVVRDGVP